MPTIEELQREYAEFVAERDWERFHTPQNLAMATSIEANELLELFLWFNNPGSEAVRDDDALMTDIEDELADVVIYAMGMANVLDLDLGAVVEQKLTANAERFDEETAAEIAEQLDRWQ